MQWDNIQEPFKTENKNNSIEKWGKDISNSLMSKSKGQKKKA